MHKHIRSLLIVAMLSAPGSTGCTAAHKAEIKTAITTFVDCSKTSLTETIVEAVAKALAGGASDWQSQLEDVGKSAGGDALACAVKTVKGTLMASSNGSGMSTSEMSPAAQRAEQTISKYGWRFEP